MATATVTVGEALRGLVLTVDETAEAVQKLPKMRTVWPLAAQGQYFCDAVSGPRRYFNFVRAAMDKPAPTIPVMLVVFHPTEPRLFAIPELRRLCSFPDDWQDGAPA